MAAEPPTDPNQHVEAVESQPDRSSTIGTGTFFAIGCVVAAVAVIAVGVLLVALVR